MDTAAGVAAFLDIDTYITAYLETVNWIGTDSVADGGVTVSEIWQGLRNFVMDHWVITLPGIGAQYNSSFVSFNIDGSELTIAINAPYTLSDTVTIDLGTDLDAAGLELDAALNLSLNLSLGLSFSFTVDLAGENSSFDFGELFFDAALNATGIDLGISYGEVGISTNAAGTASLRLGGSVYMQDGEFTFDHSHNKAGTTTYQNSVSLSLPFYVMALQLGSLTFGDTDFYDGELSPGFNADLRDIGGILTEAAYLVLDWLGEEIDDVRGDLVPIYAADGSVISEGNEFLTQTIPGTDVSLNRILGLDSLLNLGQYIRHYLRPALSNSGFTRDYSIPLGNPAAAGETGTNYYGPDGPTLGGFFQYLEANWIPTLGGQAGGLAWDPIMDGDDIVGIDITFTQDFPFTRTVGLNFGEEVDSIGLSVDGDMEMNLDVVIDLAMGLSFNWDTDEIDFDIDHLIFQGHASVDDVVVGASIGPLRVSLGSETGQKGRLALDLGAEISYIDGVVDFAPTLNTATEQNNYIDVQVPIYASLGDVNFGAGDNPPRLSLSGTIFPSAGGPAMAFSHENMEQLLDFSDFNIGSLISIIQSTLDWLSDLSGSDFMSYEVPVINKTLGELFDFATTFSDRIMTQIDFERINSVQDFIDEFVGAGILPAGMNVVYDSVNRTLNLPVNFDFNLDDFNLRNLQNLGDIDYEQLLNMGAIDPEAMFDKDTILDGLLDMVVTPLRELARWELIGPDFFNPGTTISISQMVDLGLIAAGALPGTSILLTNLLNSTAVNVSLTDLFDYDLLSAANFAANKKLNFDDLMASRLITLSDLLGMGVTLYAENGTTVVTDPEDAAFVSLTSLLSQHAFGLTEAIAMGFLSQDEFDLTGTMLSIAALEAAGLIAEDALDSLGAPNIALGDLLNSDLVSVSLTDLIGEGLVGRADINDLTQVAAQHLGFEGFDLYGLVDLGMITQSHVTSFEYDFFNIKDLPIDLGFDLGGVLEMGTTATIDARVTVEAGFEWVIDFDGPTGTEGVQFLINNAARGGPGVVGCGGFGVPGAIGVHRIDGGGGGHRFGRASVRRGGDYLRRGRRHQHGQ